MAADKTKFIQKTLGVIDQLAALRETTGSLKEVFDAREYATTNLLTDQDLKDAASHLTAAQFYQGAGVIASFIDYAATVKNALNICREDI